MMKDKRGQENKGSLFLNKKAQHEKNRFFERPFSNKKGQGMSTSTIVLLVLGLIILVVLILGFTIGWQKFAPFLSSNNIDTLQTACSVSCSTGDDYGYCSLQRDVKDGVNDKFSSTCNILSLDEEGRGYGIDKCPSITCP